MVSRPPTQITPPPHGEWWRREGDRAEGTFYVGSRRMRRLLGEYSKLARTAAGRKRTPVQVTAELRRRWHVVAGDLQAELDSQVGEKRPISKVFAEWHEQREGHGLSAATLKLHHKLMAKHYVEAVGDHPLSEISLTKIDRFKTWLRDRRDAKGRGLSPVTINLRLMKLRTFLTWCTKREYLAKVPDIERVDEPGHVPAAPQPKQIRQLFDRIHKRMRQAKRKELKYQYELHETALILAPCTGLRRGEMTRLEWKRCHLDRNLVHVVDTKEGDDKLVGIADLAVAYLRRRRKKYPKHVYVLQAFRLAPDKTALPAYPNPHALTTAGRRHMRAVGIEGWKPWHGYRNFLATMGLDELGIDVQAVSAQLGHANTSTTERHYQASRTKAKLRAVKAMEPTLRSVFGRRVAKPRPRLTKRRKTSMH